MHPAIPKSIKTVHEHLHSELMRVSHAPGEVGNAAKVVLRLLQGHFEREDAQVLPLLGLLPEFAAGSASIDLASVRALARNAREEVRQLVEEHGFVAAGLEDLVRAARAGDQTEAADVSYAVMSHLRLEEEVLYPAALLAAAHVNGPQR